MFQVESFYKECKKQSRQLIIELIRDEGPHYDISREATKLSDLSSGKMYRYEYLTGEEMLLFDQSRMIKQANFTYSCLRKAFEKQIKTIKNQITLKEQIKSIEGHGKELVEYTALTKRHDYDADILL